MTLSRKRILLLLATLALVFAIGCAVAVRQMANSHLEHWSAKLTLLASLRVGALSSYFDTVRAEVTFWSLNAEIQSAQADFLEAWPGSESEAAAGLIARYTKDNRSPSGNRHRLFDANDGSAYSEAHRKFHGTARPFVHSRGYYDFFLISPAGEVLYTVEKEADFGSNLNTGAWADTGLGQVYRRALEKADLHRVVFSDMAAYGPSQDAPAVFAATVIVDDNGELLGVLAVQVPLARIQSIMQFTAGMGETGETYAVGSDLLMRSQSRFTDVHTILSTKVDTPTVRDGLARRSGVDRTLDYRGVSVLSAFDHFQFDGVTWAIMAEIDEEEIFANLAVDGGSIGGLAFLLWILSAWTAIFVGSRESGKADVTQIDRSEGLGLESDLQ